MDTQQKGQLAQLKVEQRALELGYITSKPTFDARYDLIIDNGVNLLRAQIKYGDGNVSNASGAIRVDFRKYPGNKKDKYRLYYSNEIDIMLVYIPKIDKICCLDKNLFEGKTCKHIRLELAKSNMKKGIVYAKNILW
jgi:hypothetical protein